MSTNSSSTSTSDGFVVAVAQEIESSLAGSSLSLAHHKDGDKEANDKDTGDSANHRTCD